MAPKWLGKKIGRFRLQGLLGQGAVGRVFRAEDAILHRRVALKVIVIHTEDGQINRNADQFLTEARAAAALEHPNVVQIYEAGETGNLCYIAMELLDGGSLRDLVVASGAMDPGRACVLAADAADALSTAHQAGIIHRDIKPANLMITRQGRCKVTDFGLATFGDADSVSRERAAGTPLFAAPEVIRGTTADEHSDVYSLGATLFYLLTGRPPYTGKSRTEVLNKHLNEAIPDLRALRPGLPESLVAAVERALDKDPGRRFNDAMQFARVLRVQTIPAAPMPAMMAMGDAIGGASVLNLSGMTAVSGSTGSLQNGRGGGGGMLTANDLVWLPAPSADAPPAEVKSPAPTPAPLVVHYVAPPVDPAAAPGRRSRLWVKALGFAVAVVAVVVSLGVVAALMGVKVTRTAIVFPGASDAAPAPIAAPSTPTAAPALPDAPRTLAEPVAPKNSTYPPHGFVAPVTFDPQTTAGPAATPPAVVPTTPHVTVGPATPDAIAPTDLERLTKIAGGDDPAHVGGRATIVGTVSRTALRSTGKTVRILFAGTPFAVVYFDEADLYARMAKLYGPNATTLAGKTIRITGRVKMYGVYPEMVVTSPSQVTVLDAPAK